MVVGKGQKERFEMTMYDNSQRRHIIFVLRIKKRRAVETYRAIGRGRNRLPKTTDIYLLRPGVP